MTSRSEQNSERHQLLSREKTAFQPAISNDFIKLARKLLPFSFALAYAGILASLPIDEFKDRHNYLLHADQSGIVLSGYILQGWNVVIFNEPVWRIVNILLNIYFEPEQTVRVLIFFPAFLVSYIVLKNNPKNVVWLILFLLMPDVIKFYIIQLRQGFAIAIFLAGYYAKPKWLGYGLMGAAGFVHSSFLVLGVVGILSSTLYTSSLQLTPRMRVLLSVIAFAILGSMLSSIAIGLGARQGERYVDWDAEISGLGFIFWATVLLLYISSSRKFIYQNFFPISILAFYLATYGMPVTSRVFQSGILLVLIAGLFLHGWRNLIFKGAVVFYALFLYLMRVNQPWFGWGLV